MLLRILTPLFITLLTIPCYGYHFSAGTHVPYFDRAQVNNSGTTQKFALNPYFSIGGQYGLSGAHFFSPELGYAYNREQAKNMRTELIMVHYNFSYVLNSQFLFRYGLANNWYRIVGKGGNVTLNNGNATTSFPAPDKTVTTYYTTLNLGTEYMLSNRKYSIRFDLNTMSFAKLENKVFNYLLTVNFY